MSIMINGLARSAYVSMCFLFVVSLREVEAQEPPRYGRFSRDAERAQLIQEEVEPLREKLAQATLALPKASPEIEQQRQAYSQLVKRAQAEFATGKRSGDFMLAVLSRQHEAELQRSKLPSEQVGAYRAYLEAVKEFEKQLEFAVKQKPELEVDLLSARAAANMAAVNLQEAQLAKVRARATTEVLRHRATSLCLDLERTSALHHTSSRGGTADRLATVGILGWIAAADLFQSLGHTDEEIACLKKAIEFAEWEIYQLGQADVLNSKAYAESKDRTFRMKARLAMLQEDTGDENGEEDTVR